MIQIAVLALATAAFVGTHLAMSHPWRLTLVQNLGESRFTLLYSGVAFVTLIAMILAYRAIDESFPMWIAPDWAFWAGSGVMLLASILLVGSFVKNPAFPRPGSDKPLVRPASGVFAITRHPMNWSFMLWALVHLSLWGSPRNVIVAAGILVLAAAGSVGQDRKKRASIGKSWRDWEAKTSFLPFGALVSGRASWKASAPGWLALGAGLALWLAVTWVHAPHVSPVVRLIETLR